MKKLILLLAVLIALFSCEKTEVNPLGSKYVFSESILPGYWVTCIAFDHQGNAWIGTLMQGMIKYNSGEITVFDSFNSNTSIYDIAVDSKNNVWIGCNYGLIKYDGINLKTYNSSNTPMPENFVQSVAVDSKDNIWFSASVFREGGLVKYDGSNWIVYTPENSDLPVNIVKSIAIDKNDNVWLTANETVNNSYIAKISNNNWTVYSNAEFGFTPYYFGNIQADSQNKVYTAIDYSLSSMVHHEGPGVFLFDGNSSKQISYNNHESIRHITVDNRDNVWCALNQGYAVYDGEKWTEGLSFLKYAFIMDMEQAPDNNMWIGTENGIGIVKQ